MVKTTLSIDPKFYDVFLEINNSYNQLLPVDQRRFVRRNGFDPFGYKELFESSLMTMLTFGRLTEDIQIINGKFEIIAENLTKRDPFPKVIVRLPMTWKTIRGWEEEDFDRYARI